MKPEQFIREFGVEKARDLLDQLHKLGCPDDMKITVINGMWQRTSNGFTYPELKRLVESLDRFNKFEDKQEALDAIDDAPEGATDYRKLSCGTRYIKQGPRFFEYWNGSEWCRPTVPFTVETHILRFDKLEDLKQSIKDHESIYGGGDES
ncbi:hypothetical protein V8P76_18550 [Acinetobacter baumannii]